MVANPPYGIAISDQRSKAIGNSDSYTNFMARAIEIAPKGVMAYITPTSWETGDKFGKFRKFLFGRMGLQTVVNLPYDVFEAPFVDTAITIGSMGNSPCVAFDVATLEKREEIDLTQIGDYLERVDWRVVATDSKLRVPQFGWAAELFDRIANVATPLGGITTSKRGIPQYKFNILSYRAQDALPFFTGQVQRYDVSESASERFVVVNRREVAFHEGPRMLARRLVSRANRLSFARTADDFVVKEAILPIKPKFNDARKLSVLLAILNSSLISFLYVSRSTAATKDDYRQVTLTGLRELPIVFPDTTSTERELARLVAARESQGGNVEELDRLIDEIVYELYGVTEEEQSAISGWLKRTG